LHLISRKYNKNYDNVVYYDLILRVEEGNINRLYKLFLFSYFREKEPG